MKTAIQGSAERSRPKTLERIGIFVILLLSLFLRTYDLERNPNGFWPDEASGAYDAWGLIQNGHDQHGVEWPFFFTSFADDLEGTYRYLMLIAQLILGPTMWSVRLPSALAGVMTVWILYLGIRKAMGGGAALFAAFLLAVSPWHLPYCRTGQRIMLLPLALAIWYLFWERSQRTNSRKDVFLSYCFLGLSVYTYVAARLLVLPLLIIMCSLHFLSPKIKYSTVFMGLFLFMIVLAPMGFHAMSDPAQFMLRFSQVSIFQTTPGQLDSLVTIYRNYLSHFSIDYLFIYGDTNLRHSQEGIGQLMWGQLPVLLIGLAVCLRHRSPSHFLLLGWLMVSPLPAALSRAGSPHALRSVGMMLPWIILSGYGFKILQDNFRKKRLQRLLMMVLILEMALESIWIGYDLLVPYPIYSAAAWEYGTVEAIEAAHAIQDQYEEIWFTSKAMGADRIIAFVMEIPTVEFARTGLRTTRFRWEWATPIEMIVAIPSPYRQLFIVRPEELPWLPDVREPIIRPDGSIAFRFVSTGSPDR